MSDNGWYFLALVITIVLLGFKVTAFLLLLAFFYWLIVTANND